MGWRMLISAAVPSKCWSPPDPDVHWGYPAISPDGRWIAATRWTQGRHDIALLDAHGKLVCEVTRDRALDFAPSWSANGQWLVWASDRSGIPNILAAKIDNGQVTRPVMLTNLRTGAAFPSVDPSGHWLYFSGYHVDGWEIERIPFSPTAAPPALRADSTHTAEVANKPRGHAKGQVRAYSPLETLRPYYWIPVWNDPIAVPAHRKGEMSIPRTKVLGTAIGVRTSGIDLVRRHSYTVGARIFLPVRSSSRGRAAGDLVVPLLRTGETPRSAYRSRRTGTKTAPDYNKNPSTPRPTHSSSSSGNAVPQYQ